MSKRPHVKLPSTNELEGMFVEYIRDKSHGSTPFLRSLDPVWLSFEQMHGTQTFTVTVPPHDTGDLRPYVELLARDIEASALRNAASTVANADVALQMPGAQAFATVHLEAENGEFTQSLLDSAAVGSLYAHPRVCDYITRKRLAAYWWTLVPTANLTEDRILTRNNYLTLASVRKLRTYPREDGSVVLLTDRTIVGHPDGILITGLDIPYNARIDGADWE